MKIKIIATPPGQAPEEVRKAWVSVEIPLAEQTGGIQVGVLGGAPKNLGGYQVNGSDAIKALGEKVPEAANWRKKNAPLALSNRLVFAKEVCELIE